MKYTLTPERLVEIEAELKLTMMSACESEQDALIELVEYAKNTLTKTALSVCDEFGLKGYTADELLKTYKLAEVDNDDVLYMAVMSEFERRKIQVIDMPDA